MTEIAIRRPFRAITLAGLALVAGCQRQPDSGHGSSAALPPPVQVKLIPVERRTRIAVEEVVGTVQSKLRATVEAKVSGRIQRLAVTLGQTVKAGDLIAELDAKEIQARYEQAVATRERAARDIERVRRLLEEKVVSQSEFDEAQARFRVAVASVTETETMMSYTRVTAPFDGVIARKLAEVGDLASPGKPIVDIDDPGQLRLEANVPESAINTLTLGDRLPIRVANLTNLIEGTISEIAPSADPATRTFLFKCDLPPTPGLRAGQFGRVAVPVGQAVAVRIPISALVQRGQLELVHVAISNRVHLRLVKTGKRIGSEVEVVSGLESGERVVADPPATLREGQPIQP